MRLLTQHVLFIGDDYTISQLLVRILNRAGCRASACTRKKALSLVTSNNFHCILLDWQLESDKVVRFYKKVCALAPTSSVFLFTGVAADQNVKWALEVFKGEGSATLSLDALLAEVCEEPKAKREYLVKSENLNNHLENLGSS